MSPPKLHEDKREEFLKLLRKGASQAEARLITGVSKEACQRWLREIGEQETRKSRWKRKYRKSKSLIVLDRFLASPLGTYPAFLADYRQASI